MELQKCIKKLMKEFNIKLNVDPEEEIEFDEEIKNGEETSMTYEVFQNGKQVGSVDIVVDDGEANIGLAQLSVKNVPFKMFKVILLYFVLQYDEYIYKLTLTADPIEDRCGGLKRLVNYYKTLGFTPDDKDVDYDEGVDMTTTTKNMMRHLNDEIEKLLKLC